MQLWRPEFELDGRLYSSCVQSSMLCGSETKSIRKENEVALWQTEMEWSDERVMLRQKIEFQVKELRETRDDIILVL